MMTTTPLAEFFRFNRWANLLLLQACARLTEAQLDATAPGTYGSIRQTLWHMLASEEGYVRPFTGFIPDPALRDMAAFPGFELLQERAELSGTALITIAEQGDLTQTFYLDNGTYEAQAIIVLIQALDHGIDHRSQIATLFSQQGIEPPGLDAWYYNNSLR